jgi:putative hydrolase of the HAD superfamily
MTYTTILFDLDDTLYTPGNGIWEQISQRIHQYMQDYCHIPAEHALEVRKTYFRKYGTTLRGLVIHHHIDPAHYLDFVHDFDVSPMVAYDPELHAMFTRLPHEKFIFTNASRGHAERILGLLQIQDFFVSIVDVMNIHPFCKPMPEAFVKALDILQKEPGECIFIDDSLRNLDQAKSMGLFTIYPNADNTQVTQPHTTISSLLHLPDVLPT